MTYREHIQEMIDQLQDIYDRAGMLRDHVDFNDIIGKTVFNKTREMTSETWSWLQKLDNALTKAAACEDIGNWRKK